MVDAQWAAQDSALLDELLAFLEDAPADVYGDTACENASINPGVDGVRHTSQKRRGKSGCPVKRAIDQLRVEAVELQEELQRLQRATCDTRSRAMEVAQSERFKRRRAERESQQLRDAVYAQTQFIRGLRAVVAVPPPSVASGLNLCRYLHSYTRLPRDRPTRWSEYAALAQETRLESAMNILSRETALVDVDSDAPYIQAELLQDQDSFGITSTSVYSLDSSDLSAVLRGVCVAVSDIVSTCTFYQCTSQRRRIVDPDSSAAGSNILYRVLDTRHKSRHDSDELSIESRILTLCKQTNDYALVLWDYVDDDELHPGGTDVDITREAVGACLIRNELRANGSRRTMVRAVHTRYYRFHSSAPKDVMQRFLNVSNGEMRAHEQLFCNIVVNEVAKESAVYAQAMGQLAPRASVIT